MRLGAIERLLAELALLITAEELEDLTFQCHDLNEAQKDQATSAIKLFDILRQSSASDETFLKALEGLFSSVEHFKRYRLTVQEFIKEGACLPRRNNTNGPSRGSGSPHVTDRQKSDFRTTLAKISGSMQRRKLEIMVVLSPVFRAYKGNMVDGGGHRLFDELRKAGRISEVDVELLEDFFHILNMEDAADLLRQYKRRAGLDGPAPSLGPLHSEASEFPGISLDPSPGPHLGVEALGSPGSCLDPSPGPQLAAGAMWSLPNSPPALTPRPFGGPPSHSGLQSIPPPLAVGVPNRVAPPPDFTLTPSIPSKRPSSGSLEGSPPSKRPEVANVPVSTPHALPSSSSSSSSSPYHHSPPTSRPGDHTPLLPPQGLAEHSPQQTGTLGTGRHQWLTPPIERYQSTQVLHQHPPPTEPLHGRHVIPPPSSYTLCPPSIPPTHWHNQPVPFSATAGGVAGMPTYREEAHWGRQCPPPCGHMDNRPSQPVVCTETSPKTTNLSPAVPAANVLHPPCGGSGQNLVEGVSSSGPTPSTVPSVEHSNVTTDPPEAAMSSVITSREGGDQVITSREHRRLQSRSNTDTTITSREHRRILLSCSGESRRVNHSYSYPGNVPTESSMHAHAGEGDEGEGGGGRSVVTSGEVGCLSGTSPSSEGVWSREIHTQASSEEEQVCEVHGSGDEENFCAEETGDEDSPSSGENGDQNLVRTTNHSILSTVKSFVASIGDVLSSSS